MDTQRPKSKCERIMRMDVSASADAHVDTRLYTIALQISKGLLCLNSLRTENKVCFCLNGKSKMEFGSLRKAKFHWHFSHEHTVKVNWPLLSRVWKHLLLQCAQPWGVVIGNVSSIEVSICPRLPAAMLPHRTPFSGA